jgi:[ribosomal protein S5]-alanine N-acetyltransferase
MAAGVMIQTPSAEHQAAFLQAVRRSRKLHHPWVSPPASIPAYRSYLSKQRETRERSFLICLSDSGDLVGVVNLNEIVRGNFQSAYLGYYAFEPYSGRGLMRQGMALVIQQAFGKLRLHRLEANIQPGNEASLGLVRTLGFRLEGFSRRYLKIGGRWRDHERWTLLAVDWKFTGKPSRA